jgi:hypothetical protein
LAQRLQRLNEAKRKAAMVSLWCFSGDGTNADEAADDLDRSDQKQQEQEQETTSKRSQSEYIYFMAVKVGCFACLSTAHTS